MRDELRTRLRWALLPIVLLTLARGSKAQDTPVPRLADYVGTYADSPGQTVEIADGDGLFAVVDEARYPLHASGVDQFTTITGQVVTFPRDASGKVTGYEQNGQFHPRVSTTITAASAALARPRPSGKDSPADYRYRPPANLHDGIAVGNIARSGLGVATANSIVQAILAGTYKDVHSVLLYQHGKLVLEEYFYGYSAQRPHQLRSATKSVVSALAGIAIDRGALSGVDERVLPQMRYATYDHPDPRKAGMTLGDFLAMSSGLDCNDHSADSPGRETVIDDQPDWVKSTLDLPMINDPGTKAYYCSGGVSVVGRLVENAVHMRLPEFAQANLFGPLGIAPADWKWNYDLTNADKEYSQIHLRPRDMLKLGILFADGGRWQGRQLISASWVHASLAEHSHVDNVSYGYFWWRPWLNVETPAGAQHIDLMAAQGNGGQKIYLAPQYDLVAVFTCGGYNAESTPPNTIMAKIILPALMKAASRPHHASHAK
ncbi:MAG TPA: serine hydrolase [Acidobacteriaceae bacterium]|jgi:CubicO group peptidase (beta-lactamase class C family)|nr:serine hydrolase [Acidobacteriaceae bacterium]